VGEVIKLTTGTRAERSAEKAVVELPAERQKMLYERLDAVFASCGPNERDDLIATLSTLYRWNGTKGAWDTVRRWVRDRGEKL
jgi:hypothetical protein